MNVIKWSTTGPELQQRLASLSLNSLYRRMGEGSGLGTLACPGKFALAGTERPPAGTERPPARRAQVLDERHERRAYDAKLHEHSTKH